MSTETIEQKATRARELRIAGDRAWENGDKQSSTDCRRAARELEAEVKAMRQAVCPSCTDAYTEFVDGKPQICFGCDYKATKGRVAELEATIESRDRELEAGKAFHALVVVERNAAWATIERLGAELAEARTRLDAAAEDGYGAPVVELCKNGVNHATNTCHACNDERAGR